MGGRRGKRRQLIVANPGRGSASDDDMPPPAAPRQASLQSHGHGHHYAHNNGHPAQIHAKSAMGSFANANSNGHGNGKGHGHHQNASSPSSSIGSNSLRSGSGYTPSPVPAYDRVPRTDASSSLSGSTPPPATPQQLTVATVDDRLDPAATITTKSLNSPLTFSPGEERLLIMATTADAFVHVDITGANSPEFIRERMFSKLQISDHEQHRYAIYRTEGDELPFKNTPALSGEELMRLCLAEGDRRGTLKFIVLPSMRHPLPPIDTRASAPDASSGFSPLVRVNASRGHKPSNSLSSPRDRSDHDAGYIASESEVDPPHRGLRTRGPSAAQYHAPSPASARQQQPEHLSPVKTRNGQVRGGRAASPSPASSYPGSRLGSAAPIAPIEVGQYDGNGMQRTQSNDSKRHRIRNLPIPPAPVAPAPAKPEARPAMRPSAMSSPPGGKVNMGWLRDGRVPHSNSFQSPSSARPPSPRRQNSQGSSSLKAAKSVENLGLYGTRALPITPNGDRLNASYPIDPALSASVPEPRSADPRTLMFHAPVPVHHMRPTAVPDDAFQLDWMNTDSTSSIADTLYVPEKADPIMPPPSPSFTDESTLRPDQSQHLRAVMDTQRAASHDSLIQPTPTPAPEEDDFDDSTLLIYSSNNKTTTPVPPLPPVSAPPVTMPQPMPYSSPSGPFQHQPIMVKIEDQPYTPIKSDEYDDDDSPVLKFAGGKPPPRPRPQSRFINRASVTWNVRPPPQEVYDHLEEFFPDHDLDKPLLETPVGGGAAAAVAAAISPGAESPATPLSAITSPMNGRPRRGKTIRNVATERKRMLDRTSKVAAEETPEAAMVRKRSTKLWGTKVEEVVSRAIGVPSTIPESPSTTAKPVTRWIKGDLIGKGTYGKVFLALNGNTGEMIAVKQVELPKTASDQQDHRQRIVVDAIKSESTTLRDLEHPNVVQYLGFEETSDHFNLFLEYVPGGSIAGVLRKLGKFDENVTKSFTEQILSGLEYLHSRGVWHRDLKGDNILVDAQGVCKISDFGISKRNADIESFDQGATSMQGSIFWMAPEVLSNQGQGYNVKVDIWSLGCVFVEMVTGRRPWEDENIVSVMFKVSTMREAPPVPQLDALGRGFCDLCFERDPTLRPTAAALRAHPYLSIPPSWRFQDFVTAPAGY